MTATLGLFASGASLFAQEDKADDAEPVFGKPVGGLALSLDVTPSQWSEGAEIAFACTAKNVGDKPLRVATWGLELAQVLEVSDAEGNVIKYDGGRDATRKFMGDAFITIDPGKSHTFKLAGRLTPLKTRIGGKMLIVNEILGGVWTWPLAEGDYTVRAVLDVRPDNEWLMRRAGGKDYWTGRAFSPPVKIAVGKKEDMTGKPVNGLKLTLKADKTELTMTPRQLRRATKDTPRYNVEQTKLTLTFTNVTDKPIKLNTYDLVWSGLRPDVEGPDGESLQEVGRRFDRFMAAPREEDFLVIDPGKLTLGVHPTFPGEFGPVIFHLMKPGEYRLKITYVNRPGTLKVFPVAQGSWTGQVTSNEIVLKAVAGEAE